MSTALEHTVVLALGSNLGDRRGNLSRGLGILQETGAISVFRVSSLYSSAPEDCRGGEFYNAVVIAYTGVEPRAVLGAIHDCEAALGRKGGSRDPRPIDIDILYYDDLVKDDTDLKIPHPRCLDRPFTMVPLVEVAEEWMDPVAGKSVLTVVSARLSVARTRVRVVEGPSWFDVTE